MAFYQGAIQKGKAVVMYPILDSIALIIPLVAGLFVFQQTFENTFLFVIAIIFVMIGSLVLSRYQAEIETMDVEDVKEG
jgi:multidrug transporter EmrE-like cation transporter